MPDFIEFFYTDSLSLIMMTLVGFVGITIASFSWRYLTGDRKKSSFYTRLAVLVLTLFAMVNADHLLILFICWSINNYILSDLMLHKKEWKAARESSKLARKNFLSGSLFLGFAFITFYIGSGESTVQKIISSSFEQDLKLLGCTMLILAAMTQSAIWPFHRWLISSLNSPTPVSAIMHAGLVNGGGFILARFAPLLIELPLILTVIFCFGLLTAILGTLWKLMQGDIKRMLACSTMGQMGFMFVQAGLGLFPAAVAHLCWHGLFKAYLFLGSGSAAQEKRLDLEYPPSIKEFLLALFCGAIGAYGFALSTEKSFLSADTNLFLTMLAVVTGTQLCLPVIQSNYKARLPLSVVATFCSGLVYGFSVHLVEQNLSDPGILAPQALNILHILALFILLSAWLALTFNKQKIRQEYPDWLLRLYVRMLNASQPHPATITASRNQYQF